MGVSVALPRQRESVLGCVDRAQSLWAAETCFELLRNEERSRFWEVSDEDA